MLTYKPVPISYPRINLIESIHPNVNGLISSHGVITLTKEGLEHGDKIVRKAKRGDYLFSTLFTAVAILTSKNKFFIYECSSKKKIRKRIMEKDFLSLLYLSPSTVIFTSSDKQPLTHYDIYSEKFIPIILPPKYFDPSSSTHIEISALPTNDSFILITLSTKHEETSSSKILLLNINNNNITLLTETKETIMARENKKYLFSLSKDELSIFDTRAFISSLHKEKVLEEKEKTFKNISIGHGVKERINNIEVYPINTNELFVVLQSNNSIKIISFKTDKFQMSEILVEQFTMDVTGSMIELVDGRWLLRVYTGEYIYNFIIKDIRETNNDKKNEKVVKLNYSDVKKNDQITIGLKKNKLSTALIKALEVSGTEMYRRYNKKNRLVAEVLDDIDRRGELRNIVRKIGRVESVGLVRFCKENIETEGMRRIIGIVLGILKDVGCNGRVEIECK